MLLMEGVNDGVVVVVVAIRTVLGWLTFLCRGAQMSPNFWNRTSRAFLSVLFTNFLPAFVGR
ncbi:hypothetical protein EGR_04829 [Echinococcus granulosus]|uniref:Uncharacterized protein n=1 Tax=Echinococcus granulosus TaxID=6210 RepID=W6UGZ0_ECHGR|nr:hypothetical protein EGR_04829 [Echinococcus granulosus]EUB60271.1 hypothetical protein EGR_04829 [Echinococcus granulosus]